MAGRQAAQIAHSFCGRSLRNRLKFAYRSLVTVSSAVLAVAFLFTILGDRINSGAARNFVTDYQPIIDGQTLLGYQR